MCWNVFNDSKCDPQCDTEECLYDGFDCARNLGPCNPHYDLYCSLVYANGVCNHGCDTAACNWDGLDCNHEEEQLALGTLVIIVGVTPTKFMNMSKEFLRKLGHLLRAVLLIKTDEFGDNMVYPWFDDEDNGLSTGRRRRALSPEDISGLTRSTTRGPQPDGYVRSFHFLSRGRIRKENIVS